MAETESDVGDEFVLYTKILTKKNIKR